MAERVGRGQTIRLDAVFSDSVGALVTPTSPLVDVLTPADAEVVTDAVPTEQSEGHWYYDYAVPVDAPLGTWTAHWTATINGTAVADDDHFEVVEGGEISFPPTMSFGGPCDLWATSDDVRACAPFDDTTDFTAAAVTQALTAASEVMYALGGHRWPGLCTDTVIPRGSCQAGCWPIPLPLGGVVARRGCHAGGCCGGFSSIDLDRQIVSITEVRENGVAIDSSLYVVVDGTHLARTDGTSWPCCVDPTQDPPELEVEFLYGGNPPEMGVMATTALARELLLAACGSDACRLDRRVRTVAREGVTMDYAMPGLAESLAGGQTGIPEIDLFVHAHNPSRLRRRPRVLGLHR